MRIPWSNSVSDSRSFGYCHCDLGDSLTTVTESLKMKVSEMVEMAMWRCMDLIYDMLLGR